MISETIEVNGKEYTINIHLEKRKTSLCSIGKYINIRLPLFLNQEARTKEIIRMKAWAINSIEKNPPRSRTKEYKDGDNLTIGDKVYTLVITIEERNNSIGRLRQKDNHLILKISSNRSETKKQEDISKLINKIIARERLPLLEKKIKELNLKYFQENLGRINFKNVRSRWGSCSQKKNINISTRLLLAPEEVLEYVCIHELAHLKHLDHSDKFWSLIKIIDPSYKDKQKWLKANGKDLIL